MAVIADNIDGLNDDEHYRKHHSTRQSRVSSPSRTPLGHLADEDKDLPLFQLCAYQMANTVATVAHIQPMKQVAQFVHAFDLLLVTVHSVHYIYAAGSAVVRSDRSLQEHHCHDDDAWKGAVSIFAWHWLPAGSCLESASRRAYFEYDGFREDAHVGPISCSFQVTQDIRPSAIKINLASLTVDMLQVII